MYLISYFIILPLLPILFFLPSVAAVADFIFFTLLAFADFVFLPCCCCRFYFIYLVTIADFILLTLLLLPILFFLPCCYCRFYFIYLAAVADFRGFLQQVVTDLPELHVLEADLVRGVTSCGEHALVHHGRVVTGLTDACLGRA